MANEAHAESLHGFQRRALRGMAHSLKPVVEVGSGGVTESLLEAVADALADHELIKIRIAEERSSRHLLAEQIARATRSELAGVVGHVAILYRPASDPELRKVVLPARPDASGAAGRGKR